MEPPLVGLEVLKRNVKMDSLKNVVLVSKVLYSVNGLKARI